MIIFVFKRFFVFLHQGIPLGTPTNLCRRCSMRIQTLTYYSTAMKRIIVILAITVMAALPAKSQIISVQTNALDWAALGTINLQGQVSFAQNYSVFVEGRLNPWKFNGGQMQLGQRKLSMGVRYWPWYVYSGMWVAASAQVSSLDFNGIFKMDKIHATGGVGAGLSVGYSFMLSKVLNLDLGAGLCVTRYRSYVVNDLPDDKGSQSFIQPDFLSASLVYVFR